MRAARAVLALVAAVAAALATITPAAPATAQTQRDVTAKVHRVCTDNGATRVVLRAANHTGHVQYVTFDWRFTDTGVQTISTWVNPGKSRKKAFTLTGDRGAHVTIARGEGTGDPIVARTVHPRRC